MFPYFDLDDVDDEFSRIMAEADHLAGVHVPGLAAPVPPTIDVRAIRRGLALSQPEFAGRIGVSVHTLRGWEQGRRAPEGPARVLLAMLERAPGIVGQTLGLVDVQTGRMTVQPGRMVPA